MQTGKKAKQCGCCEALKTKVIHVQDFLHSMFMVISTKNNTEIVTYTIVCEIVTFVII